MDCARFDWLTAGARATVADHCVARPLARPPLGPEYIVLGRAVRELRVRRFLTQAGLGAQAALHRNFVGSIERGEINPTSRVLRKLGRGLQLPLSELIGPVRAALGRVGGRPMLTTTVRLDHDLMARATLHAERLDIAKAALIRDATFAYVIAVNRWRIPRRRSQM